MKKLILLLALTLTVATASFANIKVSQNNWRWRNNDGSESTATWKAAQNTTAIIGTIDSIIRLRVQCITNNDGDDKTFGPTLQYASAPGGPWYYVTNFKGNNAFMYSNTNVNLKDTSYTTKQLTGSSLSFLPGRVFVKTNEFGIPMTQNQVTELEYSIQPTDNISPNTKYYFRLSGTDSLSASLPSLLTTSGINTKAKLLSNGSFENGFADWNFNVGGSSSAVHSIIDTVLAEGTKSAWVKLDTRSAVTGVSLSHKPVTLKPGHVYMVHFYANTTKDGGKAQLVLKGKSKVLKYDFAFNFRGMNEYEFAFKAVDPSVTLAFLFLSKAQYVIDDVQIWDENNDGIDVPMNYMWQNNRPPNEYEWLSADGENSQLLPDGRVVWNFSDGYYGYNDTTTNSLSANGFLRNTLVEQTSLAPNGILHTHQGGTPDKPDALLKPAFNTKYHDDFFWPRDMIVENDTLKILLPEVTQKTSSSPLSDGHRQALGVVSLPDLKVQKITYMPWLDSAYAYYNAFVQADDGYTYVYGGDSAGIHIARYPSGKLNLTTPWEFLHDKGWTKSYYNSKVITDFGIFSVTRLGPNNYVAIGKPLGFSDLIEAVYAQSPVGPWVGRTIIAARVPVELRHAVVLNYFPVIHEETEKNGVYTISMSNIGDIGQMVKDKRLYWPSFYRVNLKLLSPFTNTSSPAKVFEFAAQPADKKVMLDWKTVTETDNDHFEIEHSADGVNNWSAIASVKSKGNSMQAQSYKTYDAQPFNGDNYYRLKQVNANGKASYSMIKLVNIRLITPSVNVYPNPSKGDVFLQLENYAGSQLHLQLSNMDGTKLFNKDMQVQSSGSYKILFNSQPAAGVYNLLVTGNEVNQVFKIVIQ